MIDKEKVFRKKGTIDVAKFQMEWLYMTRICILLLNFCLNLWKQKFHPVQQIEYQ